MTWILFLYVYSTPGFISMSTTEFTSSNSCELAASEITKNLEHIRHFTFCIRK